MQSFLVATRSCRGVIWTTKPLHKRLLQLWKLQGPCHRTRKGQDRRQSDRLCLSGAARLPCVARMGTRTLSILAPSVEVVYLARVGTTHCFLLLVNPEIHLIT